jgi:hypothetical protein
VGESRKRRASTLASSRSQIERFSKLFPTRAGVADDLKRKLALAAAKEGMDLSTFARHSMIQPARALGVDV